MTPAVRWRRCACPTWMPNFAPRPRNWRSKLAVAISFSIENVQNLAVVRLRVDFEGAYKPAKWVNTSQNPCHPCYGLCGVYFFPPLLWPDGHYIRRFRFGPIEAHSLSDRHC